MSLSESGTVALLLEKEEAIVALLTCRTTEEAAHAVGISGITLLRWQKEPEFRIEYLAAKRAAFGQSIARVHHLTSSAVSTLGKIMLDANTPAATRARAADSILNHARKAIEIEDIEVRVSELERANKGAKPGNKK